jgi:integrase
LSGKERAMAFENRQQLERRRWIDREEYGRLLKAAKGDRRAWTTFVVIANIGLRVGEFHRMKESDLSKSANEVAIHTEKQKKGKWRRIRHPRTQRIRRVWIENPHPDVVDTVPISAELMRILRDWVKSRGIPPGTTLFCWSKRLTQKMFDRYAKKAGIKVLAEPGLKGRGIHCLRHFRGFTLAQAGKTAHDIREALRQRSVSSTDVYLHSNRLREIADEIGCVKE